MLDVSVIEKTLIRKDSLKRCCKSKCITDKMYNINNKNPGRAFLEQTLVRGTAS